MAYGIDSTIQDKVNAFRGQPQQLMQQYGQSQQLIDLLALQQIKSEKEAAARQIQMAMAQKQGQPTTIAQQREQEVMGLTRNEIAKRVQQGMPQQPQAPQQAPQQGPQGGGISALPAPNMQGMQNMAGGGIVAFAGTEGSDVPNPDDKKPRDEGVQDPYEIVATDENGDPITRADYERMRAGFNSLNNAGSNVTYGKATPIAEANGFGNPDIELPKTAPMAISSGNPVRDMRLRNMEKRQEKGIASLRAETEGDLGSQGSAIPPTEEASSPIGRLVGQQLDTYGKGMDERKLREQVMSKYRRSAGPLGLFKNQTDEERANAREIISAAERMTTEQLKEVLSTGKMPSPTDSNVSPELALSLALGGKKTAPPAAVAPQGIAKLAADKAAPATQAAPVAQRTMADAASAGIIPTSTAPTTSSGGIEDIIKRVNSGYNMDEINKQRADIAAQIAKLNAEQNDPSTQNRDRLAAFLSAAGAGTSLASGARLGGAAVNELNATRQAAHAAQLKDLQTTADSRAKELMEMGMKRTDAIERAYAEANQTAAVTRGQDVQATSAANQTAAYNLNSQRDFDAAKARFDAEDRRTAEAERVADKRLDAALLASQNIDSAGREKIMAEFDSNYASQAEASVIKQITDIKGKNAAETAKKDGTVQRQVDSIGKEFLLGRIRAIQGSYGGAAPTPSANPNDPLAKFYR